MNMTKEQAEQLAKFDETYRARKVRGQWIVWCDASDHVVEFDSLPRNNFHNLPLWRQRLEHLRALRRPLTDNEWREFCALEVKALVE
jgi:hypothetical protein